MWHVAHHQKSTVIWQSGQGQALLVACLAAVACIHRRAALAYKTQSMMLHEFIAELLLLTRLNGAV